MSLIKCPECQHEVSGEAESCPQCAHPMKPPAARPQTLLLGALLLVVIVFAGFSTNFARATMSQNLYAGAAMACVRESIPGLLIDAFAGTTTTDLMGQCTPTWFRAIRYGLPTANAAGIAESLLGR